MMRNRTLHCCSYSVPAIYSPVSGMAINKRLRPGLAMLLIQLAEELVDAASG